MYYIIEYAYPTSTTANKFGYGKTGCYTVELCPDTSFQNWKTDRAFATKEEARAYAELLDLPAHPLALRFPSHM